MKQGIESTVKTVLEHINENTTAEIEYLYNQNVRTREDGINLINQIHEISHSNHIPVSLTAWYDLWLVSIQYFLGNHEAAAHALEHCEDVNLSVEQRRLKDKFSALFGFHPAYQNWTIYETENIVFHYRVDENSKTRLDEFALSRQAAFTKINEFFNCRLERKIDFFLWDSQDEAFSVLNRYLGFAIGQYYLVHNALNQTVGHELSHIITYYLDGSEEIIPLICEGAAVLFDQSGRDNLAFTKRMMEKNHVEKADVKALWQNFFSLSSGVSYPLAAVFSETLLKEFGKEHYLELMRHQTYEGACSVLGKEKIEEAIRKTEALFS